jgi:hypothetical protein
VVGLRNGSGLYLRGRHDGTYQLVHHDRSPVRTQARCARRDGDESDGPHDACTTTHRLWTRPSVEQASMLFKGRVRLPAPVTWWSCVCGQLKAVVVPEYASITIADIDDGYRALVVGDGHGHVDW